MRAELRALVACMTALAAIGPAPARACGGPYGDLDVPYVRPRPGGPRYLEGELGIVRADFPLVDLLVAYRHLSGAGMSPLAIEGVREALAPEPGREDGVPALDAYGALRARYTATAFVAPLAGRWTEDYVWVHDCLPDAFRHAEAVLRERSGDPVAAASFVAGQDVVFAACDRTTERPFAALPADASPIVRDDRAYQEAAQRFYLERYDDALARFTALAEDHRSVHRATAALVVARVHQRKSEALAEAETHAERGKALAWLDRVLADETLASVHDAARSYRRYVQRRMGDASGFSELVRTISEAPAGEGFAAGLRDLRFLDATGSAAFAGTRFGDFLRALRDPSDDAFAGAWSAYRAHGGAAFLLAALTRVDRAAIEGHASEVSQLLEAAARVPDEAPGYVSIRYERARVLVTRGDSRAVADELFALRDRLRASGDPDSQHQVDLLAFRAARTLDELLLTMGDVVEPRWGNQPNVYLHPAAEDALLGGLAVRDWIALVDRPSVPEAIRHRLEEVGFARALRAGDDASAETLGRRVRLRVPALTAAIDAWLHARPGAARRRARLALLLEAPDSSFSINVRYESATHFCAPERERSLPPEWQSDDDRAAFAHVATVLGRQRLERGVAEQRALVAAGAAATFFAREAAELAEGSPDRAHDAEMLGRAVRATRRACGDERTVAEARRAFRLLHARYPDDPETAQTRYYYAGR